MLLITIKLENTIFNGIPVYVLDIIKSEKENHTFYGNLQD